MKRLISVILCVALAFSFFALAAAEDLPTIIQGKPTDQTVRVRLTRLGEIDRLDLTLNASYLVRGEHTEAHFQPGSQIAFLIDNEKIYMYYEAMAVEVGERVTIARTGSISDARQGFLVTNFPTMYLGDLELTVSKGKFEPVLSIHVEDYLLGVVPYEMGDSFPLEALKVQAIAARTYALKSKGKYGRYDLLDNTNDQVFKGYLEGNPKSERAIQETRGICGYYQGELAQCFYSASNGGQTELVQTVWSSREPHEYYASVADPYDIENPESVVSQFRIPKNLTTDQYKQEMLGKLIFEYLPAHLKLLTDNQTADAIRIDRIHAVHVDQSASPGSLLMTNMQLEIEISVRQDLLNGGSSYADMEEVYLFSIEENSIYPLDHTEQNTTSLVPFSERVIVNIPVFPVAEKAFSLSINSNYSNEIWSVAEEENAFVIEARRYGHGVGMSQRGAQWMAAEYNKNYQEILAFYYPGMDLIQFPEQPRNHIYTEEALLATAGPAPTPTPRPTLMPLSLTPKKGQWYAAVTEIAEDSSLNLRAEPTLNAEILMRLYKGQRLLVLEKAFEDGWVHVITDSAEGYVLEKYLTREQ